MGSCDQGMPSRSAGNASRSRSKASTRYVNLAERIPWQELTEDDRETLREIAVPISLGLCAAEVAAHLDVDERVVLDRLQALRVRLLQLAGETG